MENPKHRLTESEIADLSVVVAQELCEDTRLALERNFPPEQLPPWESIRAGLETGWYNLHELRSKTRNTLLSARLMYVFNARKRGEKEFLMVSWVVTPDPEPNPEEKQGKGKGYGSYLRQLSYELSRNQHPHAVGLLAEREAAANSKAPGDQVAKRVSWMKRLGLLRVKDFDYEIPPMMTVDERCRGYVLVAEREKAARKADLLLSRFDGEKSVDGKTLFSIVERIYKNGYGLKEEDPYLAQHISLVDLAKEYELSED